MKAITTCSASMAAGTVAGESAHESLFFTWSGAFLVCLLQERPLDTVYKCQQHCYVAPKLPQTVFVYLCHIFMGEFVNIM